MPVHLNPKIDIRTAEKKAQTLAKDIDHLYDMYKQNKFKEVYNYSGTIKGKVARMRRCGLVDEGIYSPENLAFKMLRNSGFLQKLSSLKIQSYDKMMSLNL